MTECINVYCAVFAVVRCPSVCHVDVSKWPNLQSNFFIAWWPHHSSFPKGDPTVKFRRGHPQQGRQIDQKFAIFNQYFRNTEYRTDMKKYRRQYRIPIPTPNTDTDPALLQNITPISNIIIILKSMY